ncbi:hypothetical protein LWI28_021693 [Acer negundo]|uniref:Uncharacterized protein n=1 Tax=Acer negundo TaxID=4023 RepID=A0AAD5NYG8_ACENE|nr:hypothetical protein LWI28_021693 [Acer negundo]
MTHENQTEITKTHTHFSHETYRGTSLGAWSDTATNRKLKHLNSVKLHFDPTMSNESLSNSQFIGKAKEINVVNDIHNRGMNNVQSKMEESVKGFSDGKAEMMSKIEMLDEVMVGECVEFGNANESLDLSDRSPLDTIVCDSVHFVEPMNEYCAKKNYKTIPKHKPTLPKGRPTTLVDMMQFVSDCFDFEENENTSCDVLGDIIVIVIIVFKSVVADCGNSVQVKFVDCFDVVKNVEVNDKIEFSISENFIQPMMEAFDLEVVIEVHFEPTNQVGEGIDTIKVQLEERQLRTLFLKILY